MESAGTGHSGRAKDQNGLDGELGESYAGRRLMGQASGMRAQMQQSAWKGLPRRWRQRKVMAKIFSPWVEWR